MFCQNRSIRHALAMKTVWTLLVTGISALTLSNCANSGGGGQSGTGPFDSRGNYVEAWADNPSKWKKTPGAPSPHEQRSDELPEIASNEQPPSNAVPIVSGGGSKPAPVISTTEVTQRPKATSNSSSTANSKPKPKVVVKAKPKPKPKAVKYVVKSGDSLSAIASRTGSSVSAIQKANGISGTLIRPGQSLTIPKKK
jgi:LysM repeat protein